MKWIYSTVAGFATGRGANINHINVPVNLAFVEYISSSEYIPEGTDAATYAERYIITFCMSRNQISWIYPDKLTRDNRLSEIMQYLDAKSF